MCYSNSEGFWANFHLLYTHICHWSNLPIELEQSKSKTSFRKKVTTLRFSRLLGHELQC